MTNYRITSETRTSYLLGDLSIPKHACKESLYVGDYVSFDGKKLTLISRKNLVTKSSNMTVKDFHRQAKNQGLASNVDAIFIVIALDNNFSLAKIERYYLVFYQEGIDLHFILTKKDLVTDANKLAEQIRNLYPHISLTLINNHDSSDLKAIEKVIQPNQTFLLLGASGAGKSTLLNNLLGQELVKTNQTRTDGKGRHTTTSSLLLNCPTHQCQIIDTPGFKGIDKVSDLDLSLLFSEIIDLAQDCHFPNCKHQTEPKCAVKQALESGTLSEALWDRYQHFA